MEDAVFRVRRGGGRQGDYGYIFEQSRQITGERDSAIVLCIK